MTIARQEKTRGVSGKKPVRLATYMFGHVYTRTCDACIKGYRINI